MLGQMLDMDRYNGLPFKGRHVVRNGEELIVGDIKAHTNGVYKGDQM